MPDAHAAQQLAIHFAGDVLRHEPDRLKHGELRVFVSNADGETLFSIDIVLHDQ